MYLSQSLCFSIGYGFLFFLVFRSFGRLRFSAVVCFLFSLSVIFLFVSFSRKVERQLEKQKREEARLKSRFKEEAKRLCSKILDLEEDLEEACKEKKKADEQYERERQEKELLKSVDSLKDIYPVDVSLPHLAASPKSRQEVCSFVEEVSSRQER